MDHPENDPGDGNVPENYPGDGNFPENHPDDGKFPENDQATENSRKMAIFGQKLSAKKTNKTWDFWRQKLSKSNIGPSRWIQSKKNFKKMAWTTFKLKEKNVLCSTNQKATKTAIFVKS